ncbi:YjbH domain-containing protein [Enterobacter hormaechei]
MNKLFLLSGLALAISSACHAELRTWPDPTGPSQSDFGGTGLMQMPDARFGREGEFSVNYRDNDQYRFYFSSVVLFPWLEGTIRYTDVRTRKYSSDEDFSGDQSYKDKSFDFKVRLWEEDYSLPQVALGKRDIAGTGLFDGEYLVASKMAGPVDFTFGIAWGYPGNSDNVGNPLCHDNNKYCTRGESHDAGDISFSDMFRGPTSLFGGLQYQTPWQPLRLKLEYDGNNYADDFAGSIKQSSHINVGAVYRVADWADLNLSYERGNTLMFGFTLRTNFNDLRPALRDNPKPAWKPAPAGETLDYTSAANQLTALKYNAGFDAPEILQHGNTLYMTGEQYRYRDPREAVDRANRILINNLPDGVDTIAITQRRDHLPLVTTQTDVTSLRKQLAGQPLGQEEALRQQRVRTHIRDYVSNDVYINNLQANYVDALGHGFYAQIYGGYLETMYGGVGVEALWRPLDSDWALGVDANYVKQRDWDDMMRFTDYSAPTGFITAYWNPAKLNSVLMKLSVGQYLAKDKGATLDVAKRFDSGVTVGAWAALTNVSKEDYGEGGFSKGFYISIPLDLMTIGPNRNRAVVSWTPLTRDGGQTLGRKYQLYDMTSERETPVGQ